MISPASKGTSRRVVWAGMAALAGLAIIAGGAIWYQRSRPSRPVLQPTESLLFSAPGFLSQPNLSPDGNQVAFTCDGGTNGYTQIYLKIVGSGEPLRLTNGNANALSPVWSRDGAAIAYTSSNGDNRAILPGARVVGVRLNHVVVISALGGAAREVFSYEGELTRVSWSADGRTLFIPDGKAVYIVSMSDREKRKILDALFWWRTLSSSTTVLSEWTFVRLRTRQNGPLTSADHFETFITLFRLAPRRLPVLYRWDWSERVSVGDNRSGC